MAEEQKIVIKVGETKLWYIWRNNVKEEVQCKLLRRRSDNGELLLYNLVANELVCCNPR